MPALKQLIQTLGLGGLIFGLPFSAQGQLTSSELVINELLASNSDAYTPDNGESFPDVIELRNLTSSDLDLSGYGISDNDSPSR